MEISETENYTYQFRVCRQVNDSSHDFAGLIQRDRKTGKTTVVGRINETQVFNGSKAMCSISYLVSLAYGSGFATYILSLLAGDWIMLIYKGGDSYGTHCSGEKRRAVIMISCKRGVTAVSDSARWERSRRRSDIPYNRRALRRQ